MGNFYVAKKINLISYFDVSNLSKTHALHELMKKVVVKFENEVAGTPIDEFWTVRFQTQTFFLICL